MDMIGHDGVGEHLTAVAFKVMQSVDQGPSVLWMTQKAFATTFVEDHFQLPHLRVLKVLPRGPFLGR